MFAACLLFVTLRVCQSVSVDNADYVLYEYDQDSNDSVSHDIIIPKLENGIQVDQKLRISDKNINKFYIDSLEENEDQINELTDEITQTEDNEIRDSIIDEENTILSEIISDESSSIDKSNSEDLIDIDVGSNSEIDSNLSSEDGDSENFSEFLSPEETNLESDQELLPEESDLESESELLSEETLLDSGLETFSEETDYERNAETQSEIFDFESDPEDTDLDLSTETLQEDTDLNSGSELPEESDSEYISELLSEETDLESGSETLSEEINSESLSENTDLDSISEMISEDTSESYLEEFNLEEDSEETDLESEDFSPEYESDQTDPETEIETEESSVPGPTESTVPTISLMPTSSPVPTASPQPVPIGSSLCLCVGSGCECPDGIEPNTEEEILLNIPYIEDKTNVRIYVTGEGSAKLNFNSLSDSFVHIEGTQRNNVNLTLDVIDHPKRFSIANLTVNAVREIRDNVFQMAEISQCEEIILTNVSAISGSVRVTLDTEILTADLISLASGFNSISVTDHFYLTGSFNEKTITPVTFSEGGKIDIVGEFPLISVGNNKVFVSEDKQAPLKHSFENIVKAVIYSSSNQKVKLIRDDADVEFRKLLETRETPGLFPTNLYVPRGGSLTLSGRSLEPDSSATNNQFVISSTTNTAIQLAVNSYFLPFSFKDGTTVALKAASLQMATGSVEANRYANTNFLIDTNDEITQINMTAESVEYTLADGSTYTIPKSIANNVGPFSSNVKSTLNIYVHSDSGSNYIYAADRSLTKLYAYGDSNSIGSASITFVVASNEIEVEKDASLAAMGVEVSAVDEQGSEVDLSKVGIPVKNELSGGAIAGIVIAVIVVVAALVGLAIFLVRKNNEASSSSTPNTIVPKSPTHGKKKSGSIETFQYSASHKVDDEEAMGTGLNEEGTTMWNGNFW